MLVHLKHTMDQKYPKGSTKLNKPILKEKEEPLHCPTEGKWIRFSKYRTPRSKIFSKFIFFIKVFIGDTS